MRYLHNYITQQWLFISDTLWNAKARRNIIRNRKLTDFFQCPLLHILASVCCLIPLSLLSWSIMSSFFPSVFMLFSGCLGFELLNLSFLMSLWHPSASRQRGDNAVLPLAPHIGRLSVLYICQPSIYTLWSHRSGIEISSLSRGHTVPSLIWKELEVKCRGKQRVWTCGNTQWTINSNLVSIFISIINESC